MPTGLTSLCALLFASADFRVLPRVFPGGQPVTFQGSFPHSALIVERDSQISRLQRSPSTGFLNLTTGHIRSAQLAGLFHPACTPRVPTFRALQQNDRSFPYRRPCSCIINPSSWIPSNADFGIPNTSNHNGLTTLRSTYASPLAT